MTTLLKFIHIATIAIWSGGLICLPFLFAQRRDVGHEHALHRLHAMVRFLYVAVLSPAAFIAIGSGIVLVFLQATYDPWFALKMGLVGLMVLIHVLSGLLILKLFDETAKYSRLRYVVVTGGTLAVVTGILVLVSAKPVIHLEQFYPDWVAPGALSEVVVSFTGWEWLP